MPNRILKESICSSETIDRMTPIQENFFCRLIVNCDDYGRMDARPTILKAKLFPLKERMTLREIGDALRALANIGCVCLYEVGGKPYLYFPSWEVHQTVRAKKSKFPAPDESLQAPEIICKQMQADVPVIQSNPNPIRESNSRSDNARESRFVPPVHVTPSDFATFWEAYPKKRAKGDAEKAWKGVKAELSVILEAVERQSQSHDWQKDGGKFIPHPATWLRGKRWEDAEPEDAPEPIIHESPPEWKYDPDKDFLDQLGVSF